MKIPRLKGNASQKNPPSIIVHKNAYEITADICGFMYMSLIEYKDRLARFSCHKLEQYANSYGVMIEVIDEQPSKGLEAELVEDRIVIVSSFAARLYERRSLLYRNMKTCLEQVVETPVNIHKSTETLKEND